jgi:phosphopantothenoylcysteine decarboxylase/phosphopantothenate--cysteine ligase
MAEPENIQEAIREYFDAQLEEEFKGKKVLVTAGPTFESIDPVRFIGNHSSGKMGYRIAQELLNRGAHVILVSGPTKEELEHDNLTLLSIKSAEEMLSSVQSHWKDCSYGVFSAAVADYRPKSIADQKIKKNDDELSIELIKNPDVLKWAGDTKSGDQILVGFALETNDLVENGKKKLAKKNLNLIVLNTLEDKGAGFGVDTNKISILDNHNNIVDFELKSKKEVARDIVSHLKTYISK